MDAAQSARELIVNIAERIDLFLDSEFAGAESSVYRDLSLNFKKLMEEGALEPQERFMNLLAISVALREKSMAELAKAGLRELGLTDEQIREAAESAGIMGMNNVYYKFRNFLSEEAREHYHRAGLRMQSLMRPANGKQAFEMLSLSVSIVNGCPACVASHENVLRGLGLATDKIHDLARLASVAKGLSSLKTARAFLA